VYRHSHPKLCALVAYYPSAIPDPNTSFPISLRVVVHLAGTDVGVTRNAEVLGIQGKRKTRSKRIGTGLGYGGGLDLAYPSYTYADVEPGFAEKDLPEFDKVADRLAWTRTLECIRKGFRVEVDLERIWEEHTERTFHLSFRCFDVRQRFASLTL